MSLQYTRSTEPDRGLGLTGDTKMLHHTFLGSDLFDVRQASPVPGGWGPGTLQFIPRGPRIEGAGIYAIFFERDLIYIGVFRGTKANPWAGELTRARWQKHIQTLTGRGRDLSLARRSAADLLAQLGDDTATGARAICEALRAAEPDVLAKDRGCCTTAARLRFAARHWERFDTPDRTAAELRHFRFAYVQLAESDLPPGCDNQWVRTLVSKVESEMITRFSPPANTGRSALGHPTASEASVVGAIQAAFTARFRAHEGPAA